MADANARVPAEARDRLAEQARQQLQSWNGYDPDTTDTTALDAELDRRLAQAAIR